MSRKKLMLTAMIAAASVLGIWALLATHTVRPRLIKQAIQRIAFRAEARATVKKPWDPDNPYRAQYDEADYWIYEHLAYVEDIQDYASGGSDSRAKLDAFMHLDGTQLGTLLVDGYLLPYREFYRQQAEAFCAGRIAEFNQQGIMVVAAGPASAEEEERLAQLQWELKADLYPWVPDWLALNPPLRAQILPDGSVLTKGALGSGSGLDREQFSNVIHRRFEEERAIYCYYSPRGELISDTMSEYEVPGFQKLPLAELTAQGQFHIDQGYIELRDKKSEKVMRLWDFDGRELPLDTVREKRINNFRRINCIDLQRLYRIQRERSAQPPGREA